MAIYYKQCPKCGSKNTIKIVYGMPNIELYQKAERGKVKLGGCVFIVGSPEYFCNSCENEWNREQAIDIAYGKIKTIKASVGGFFGGYYEVTIDLINLETTWSLSIDFENPSIKALNKEIADAFLEQLKMINLLNWKTKYIEPGVCDGTQWSIEIFTDGRTIRKNGSNKFPVGWESFCNLVEQLTGKEFR